MQALVTRLRELEGRVEDAQAEVARVESSRASLEDAYSRAYDEGQVGCWHGHVCPRVFVF